RARRADRSLAPPPRQRCPRRTGCRRRAARSLPAAPAYSRSRTESSRIRLRLEPGHATPDAPPEPGGRAHAENTDAHHAEHDVRIVLQRVGLPGVVADAVLPGDHLGG